MYGKQQNKTLSSKKKIERKTSQSTYKNNNIALKIINAKWITIIKSVQKCFKLKKNDILFINENPSLTIKKYTFYNFFIILYVNVFIQ